MGPKWDQSGTKMGPKWDQNGTKKDQESKKVPKVSQGFAIRNSNKQKIKTNKERHLAATFQ